MTLMSPQPKTHLQEVWGKWKQNGDVVAQRQLIEQYVPLVDYVAAQVTMNLPRNVMKEDIVSYGIMGLYDAIGKFDLSRGLRFETYAIWRIRGAIIDGLRQLDWVPRSVREKVRKVEEAYQVLEQQMMRSVTVEEVRSYLSVGEQEFKDMIYNISYVNPISLEEPVRPEDQEPRLAGIIDEQSPRPEYTVRELFLKQCLAIGIERLTERERTVVSLFYFEELSLSEIATVMNLSPSRISQLHTRAMERMRSCLSTYKEQLMNE